VYFHTKAEQWEVQMNISAQQLQHGHTVTLLPERCPTWTVGGLLNVNGYTRLLPSART